MAASQSFAFIPPDTPGITTLHVEEAPSASGSWLEIDTTTAVGTFPGYISTYSTDSAFDATDWFRIRWSDGAGAFTPYSQPLKGTSSTVVGEIVKRAKQRNRRLDTNVLSQEAEAVIQYVLGNHVDPYDTTLLATLTYRQLNGLTYLTMANTMIATDLGGGQNVASAGIGLVQFKSEQSSKSSATEIAALIELANAALNITTSFVLQIETIWCRGPYVRTSDFRAIGPCAVLEA